MEKGVQIMNPKSKKEEEYMSPYYVLFLYSILVHVGSPKYKMICPKSSEFAILTNSGKT